MYIMYIIYIYISLICAFHVSWSCEVVNGNTLDLKVLENLKTGWSMVVGIIASGMIYTSSIFRL